MCNSSTSYSQKKIKLVKKKKNNDDAQNSPWTEGRLQSPSSVLCLGRSGLGSTDVLASPREGPGGAGVGRPRDWDRGWCLGPGWGSGGAQQDAGDYKHQLSVGEGNLGCRSGAHTGRKVGQLKQTPCLEVIITEHKRGLRPAISKPSTPASGWGLAAVGIRRQESRIPAAKPHQAPLVPPSAACRAVPLQGTVGLLHGQTKS